MIRMIKRGRCTSSCQLAQSTAYFLAICFLTSLAVVVATKDNPASWETVVFASPTSEPSNNTAGQSIIGGGMPIGNGETTALVFPITSQFSTGNVTFFEGVHVLISMTTAMASDMSLLPIGLLSLRTNSSIGGKEFSQTLHLTNSSVKIILDGGSHVEVFVDANTNRIVARSNGAALDAVVQSLRPSDPFTYGGRCYVATSTPDTFFEVTAASPLKKRSFGLYHRNLDEDISHFGKPAMFNQTLKQQGLGDFVESLQSSDRWRRRQFGLLTTSPDPRTTIVTTLSNQTMSAEIWVNDITKLHAEHLEQSMQDYTTTHRETWNEFWNRSWIWVEDANTSYKNASNSLTARYAQNRYLQAIQSRTWVPIKFNGMTFAAAQLPPETNTSGPSFRQWGSSNWWQNTRLSYWNMGFAGDFDRLVTLFEYYLQMMPFLRSRTRAAFHHSGVYVTETKTLFGAYDPCDYGTPAADRNRSTDLSFGYEENMYLRFDFGGDAGLTELSMMILDHYEFTKDDDTMRRYMPILAETLDFFYYHYGDISSGSENLTIFPTQALETYQCPTIPATRENCPTNDHPTVAALHVLTERTLRLPEVFVASNQRDRWYTLAQSLPPVPMIFEDNRTVVSPYETYAVNSTRHISNVETPELYSTHPFRYFTLGRSLSSGSDRDIRPSIYCLEESKRQTCRNADSNNGWTQGLLNAALLGRAKKAAIDTLSRAQTLPAIGYRFPAFMPHFQDYEPSEDHLANMNSALQLMLVSFRDDGAGGALLFPAWPCSWDVNFKLRLPYNATVTGVFKNGAVESIAVHPPGRASFVTLLPCQDISE